MVINRIDSVQGSVLLFEDGTLIIMINKILTDF